MSAAGAAAFHAHMAMGVTTTARVWAVTRADGRVFGFTDHDLDLGFDGIAFRAGSGLTARALQQATGLSVDNSEAAGALSGATVTEEDLRAGRFDGAEIRCWQVNWQRIEERVELFRGSFGEVQWAGGAFRVELRGLAEALNVTRGRVFHPGCSAVLGDGACRFDLSRPGYSAAARVVEVLSAGQFLLALEGAAVEGGFAEGWFAEGRFTLLDGAAAGLEGSVRGDVLAGAGRSVTLWQELAVLPAVGDRVQLVAGCDRSAATCRGKFENFLNFRGFPHIPGEDWLAAYPRDGQSHDGTGWTR